jgi:hypothetical protein
VLPHLDELGRTYVTIFLVEVDHSFVCKQIWIELLVVSGAKLVGLHAFLFAIVNKTS